MKKLLSAFCMVVMSCSVVSAASMLPGDINNDGVVSLDEVQKTINAFLGLVTVTVPDAPTGVMVTAGAIPGTTALISFTPPAFNGGSTITGYAVTATPGGIAASGSASPLSLTGLAADMNYTFSLVAINSLGSSPAATASNMGAYSVVETFFEPDTQPNNSIFTGTFTFDSISQKVTGLAGSLTESMTGGCTTPGGCLPMTTVPLTYQLSSVPVTLGGVDGLLVTTFKLNTTNTLTSNPTYGGTDGWSPGTGYSLYYGFPTAENPAFGGVGNAYARIFVNSSNPATTLTQAQIDKLAYADCTAGGMMGPTCMTGTTLAGYGTVGSMSGYPVSQVIAKQ